MNNDTAFCSRELKIFAQEWGISLQFHCAYTPAGNGIAERCHCSVKQIAARMHCSILEAVYQHNVISKDDHSHLTAPANAIYQYEVRVKGIDAVATPSVPGHSLYQVRNHVWLKTLQNWCTTKFSRGQVTKLISLQTCIVNGMPHHMKDVPMSQC